MAGSSRIDELRKKFDENPRRYFAPLANEYRKLGDFDQAIFICQEFLPQQPGHMSGHIVYGQALFEGGRHEEARTVFETALTLDPENLIALRHLGDIARASGDLVSARGWYQRVLDADPRNDEIAEILQNIGGIAAPSVSGSESSGASSSPEAPAINSESTSSASTSAALPAEAPPTTPMVKSAVSDFAALIEEVRAEAAGESAATTPDASAQVDAARPETTPAIDGLQGAFVERPAPSTSGTKDESDLDALFDFPTSTADQIVEKTTDPTSGLQGSAPSSEPLADLVANGPAAASSAASAAGAFVTETMAELYLRQGHRDEAIGVFRQLVEARPDDETLRARLSSLEAESTPPVASAPELADRSETPSQGSGRSIREFLGDIAARRPRLNGSSAGETAEQPSSTQGGELPFLTDDSAASAPAASSPTDSGSLTLPELTFEAAGISHAGAPTADRPTGSAGRDSGATVAGSLGALFAEAEAPGSGSSVIADTHAERNADSADSHARANSVTYDGAADEHAPLPGRPTQPAATELSLDYVFRHITPASPAPGQASFSFDQFFSQEAQQDAATSGGEPTREPTTDESDDIQQFNAWLEGLKKS